MGKLSKEQLDKELNERMKLFCSYYIVKWNKTKSYLSAYDPTNNIDYLEELGVDTGCIDSIKKQKTKKRFMTDTTAASNAIKLLRKPKIDQYIELIRDDPAKNVGISKEWSLSLLRDIAETSKANITNIYKDWIELDDFEEMKKKHPEVMKAIEAIDYKTENRLEAVGKGDFDKIEVKYVKLKLTGKKVATTAIAEINKMMGWNAPEKIDLTTQGESLNQPPDFSNLSDKEVAAYGALKKKMKIPKEE